jgi:hypothetical protein
MLILCASLWTKLYFKATHEIDVIASLSCRYHSGENEREQHGETDKAGVRVSGSVTT